MISRTRPSCRYAEAGVWVSGPFWLSAPSAPPAPGTQKGRAGTEQKPEVVPVPAPCLVVEWELLPDAEDVDDKDDPGRDAVPQSPKQVCPPHDDPLPPISLFMLFTHSPSVS